jgi:hypothetical protein
MIPLGKERDKDWGDGKDRIQRQAVRKLAGPQPEKGLRMARKKSFDLLKKILPVGIKGEKGIIEIPLKHAIRAIHWAVGDGIDDMVSATDVVGCSRTGL